MSCASWRGAALPIRAAAIGIAALLGASADALALPITQTVPFSMSQTVAGVVFETRVLMDTQSPAASRFDPSLGTLDSVAISIAGTVTTDATGSISLTRLECPAAPVPTPCYAAAVLRFAAVQVSFGLPAFMASIPFEERSAPCASLICTANLPVLDTDFTRDALLTGAARDSYVGLAPFDVVATATGVLSFIDFNGAAWLGGFSGTLAATGTVEISYNYTASTTEPPTGVPEPATLAVLGLGVAGTALRRRRHLRRGGPTTGIE